MIALFPPVTIPALLITYSVFTRLVPLLRATLSGMPSHLLLAGATAAYFYFGFFGGLDLGGHYGVVPALFSMVSVLILLPLAFLHFVTDHRTGTLPSRGDAGASRSRRGPS